VRALATAAALAALAGVAAAQPAIDAAAAAQPAIDPAAAAAQPAIDPAAAAAAAERAAAMSDDEVSARLAFIEARLHLEARGARLWEAGWSLVYVGGLGYGAYQLSGAHDRAAETEAIVGMSKSLFGGVGLALRPLKTARAAHVLDRVPGGTPDERAQRLALAERLLQQNARETEQRFSWQHHLISIGLNLAGGAIVWAAGDLRRGAQSAGIAIAVGEINIWTRPWRAKRDLREYRLRFGGLATELTF
jgi:hypothetical protein